MRTAAQRVAAYNARMQSSQIDPTLTAVNAMQQANHADHVSFFYPKQLALRDWMDQKGINGTTAFQLEAFNGELYSIDRRFKGASAVTQATVLVTKWTALGLAAADLKEIALQVWSITVP